MNVVRSKHPRTVRELADIVMAENAIDERSLLSTLESMVADGSIEVKMPSYEIDSILDYLFALSVSGWFWITLGITFITITIVLFVPGVFPFDVLRWVLGSAFVLFLPGYTSLQLLYPKGSEIDQSERFAVAFALSLAVVALMGFALNFTPWGIRLDSVTSALGAFTTTCAIAAAYRKFQHIRRQGISPAM